jgi:DNA-binding NarL/FixJ family response regulator
MGISRSEGRRARRAAVVEEVVLQRNRAAQLLTDELGLEIVHTGATLRQFMTWLQRADRTRWPHLLILDLPSDADALRDLDVITALREAGMRVAVLSALRSRNTARRMIDMGIDAIASTSDSEEDFLVAAESALNGISMITARAQTAIRGAETELRLSRQEERALALYAAGLTIAEVADRIGVKHDTARKYLKRVRDKFTVAGRPARTKLELARIAWAEGYVVSENDELRDSALSKAASADDLD